MFDITNSTTINNEALDSGYLPLLLKSYELFNEPIVIFDLTEHEIISANEAFFKAFQYSEYDLKNTKLKDLNLFKEYAELDSIFTILREYEFLTEYIVEIYTQNKEIKTVLFEGVTETINNKLCALCKFKDITDKKNVEKVLRAHREQLDRELNSKTVELIKSETALKGTIISEKRLGDIVRNAPLGIAFAFSDGKMECPNQEFADLVGYSIEELNKLDWNVTLTPERWREIEAEKLNTLSPENTIVTYEKECIHKNGSLIPIEVRVKAIFDDDNQLVNYIGFVSDISNRKLLEQDLLDSEEKYQELVENAVIGASTTNFEGQIIYANKAYANMFGFKTTEELLKRNVIGNDDSSFGWNNPKERELMLELLKTNGYINNYNIHFKSNDGKDIQILLSATLHNNLIHGIFMNVSKEKEAEKEIRDNEEKYKTLYNNAIVALIRTDIEKGIPFEANNAAASLFGYTSIEEMINQFNTSHHFVEPNRTTFLKQLFEQETLKKFQIRCKTKEDKVFWVDAELNLNKEKGFIDWVLVDVSDTMIERTQNKKLLRAVNESPESIAITDFDGVIEYANKRFSELTGYSNEELVGANPKVLNSGYHDEAFYDDLWKTIKSGNVWKGEIYNKKKNGEFFWEQASIAPIMDGDKITHFVAIKEDVTNKKQMLSDLQFAKQKIESSEELYRGLINNLSAGIVVHAADTSILFTNKRASELLGLSNDQIKGKQAFDPDWYFTNINEVKLPIEQFPVNIIKKTNKPISDYIIGVNRPKTQDKVWLIVNGFPVLDNSGDIVEIVVSFIDFTARKNAEDELVLAKEKAEESDRLKSAFLTNMSHEIRTPMNGILGFTNLLKENNLTGEEQKEYIAYIEESSERMLNTIHQIIDISRIESGEVNLNISEFNLNNKLEHLYNIFFLDAEKKGIYFSIENQSKEKITTIKTDKSKVLTICSSLINNAIKYTNSGHVKFGYTIENINNRNNLKFYVSDTGIGIPNDKFQIIFKQFMQADMSFNRSYDGSGLGLSIAKAYTEMLGGTISLESKEGSGSTFCVSLPLENNDLKSIKDITVAYELEEKEPQSKALKILIVDDEELVRMYLGIILKGEKNELIYAESGQEALEKFEDNPDIDLILMDIKMPEMNGIEATKKIREINSDVYIIIQSAFVESGEEQEAIDSGANRFLSKPIDKNKLMGIIKNKLSYKMN